MKLVVVGSKNPVKINAAQQAFEKVFPNETFVFEGESAPSGVADQPMGDDETYQGAINRAEHIKNQFPDADFWVSMEAGCTDNGEDFFAYAWMVVIDQAGKMGKAKTGMFALPRQVAELIRGGMELGHADNVVFRKDNSKHHSGAAGLLTNDIIDRTELYVHAMILALIPFIQTEYYD